mgnify:FL=1
MRKPLAIGVATLAVLLSLGLAACGSSDDSSDTLSNSELIAQADAICKQGSDQLDQEYSAAANGGQLQGADLTAFVTDNVLPQYEEQAKQLGELQPNEDDADAYNDIVTKFNDAIDQAKADPEAALGANNPFADATQAAKDFGLTECGSTN